MKQNVPVFLVVGLAIAFTLMFPSVTTAEERDAANYVGVQKCANCHKSEERCNQIGKWQASPHAKASTKQGQKDPKSSGACLKCHATAYNFTSKRATTLIPIEEGVSCESCHGPGAHYIAVMTDRQKAIAVGLVYPATKSCKRCHLKSAFNPDQAMEKIQHPDPKVAH